MIKPCTSVVKGTGLIPGWGTEIPHAVRCNQKKKKRNVSQFSRVIPGHQVDHVPSLLPALKGSRGPQGTGTHSVPPSPRGPGHLAPTLHCSLRSPPGRPSFPCQSAVHPPRPHSAPRALSRADGLMALEKGAGFLWAAPPAIRGSRRRLAVRSGAPGEPWASLPPLQAGWVRNCVKSAQIRAFPRMGAWCERLFLPQGCCYSLWQPWTRTQGLRVSVQYVLEC